MKKPVSTEPNVEEMPGEPRLPRQTGREWTVPAGGKVGSASDSFAGDAQVKMPQQLTHVSTPIGQEHLFGKKAEPGIKMHLNPKDMSRSDNLNADHGGTTIKNQSIKAPKAKIPKV